VKLNKQQHEAFAKFFEAPTRERLRDVLKGNIGETDYLDFKREWPENTKLAKHILALANSGGGAIIVGVDQKEDGSADSVGLPCLIDKDKIYKGVKAYLPAETQVDLFDFSYQDSEYPAIKGKNFQVLLVESDPKYLPLLSRKEGDGIKANTIYVRKGTSSDEATHDDVQRIINERLETGFSSTKTLKLNEHIEQLRILDKARRSSSSSGLGALAQFSRMLGEIQISKDYYNFIDEMYNKKKLLIMKELGV
jgi:predicted HTH transcriptional regulator